MDAVLVLYSANIGDSGIMPAISDDPPLTYSVQKQNDRFKVCTVTGRTILVCDDEGSAAHYAALLNEAHNAGYKLGYRDGRNK